jgi:hypothetical protein
MQEEPIAKMPAKWQSLLQRLWASDEKPIGDFLLEIVDLIKRSKPSVAVIGLHTVMLSPKVQGKGRGFRLLTPSPVAPGYITTTLLGDAAGLPMGKVRKEADANLKQALKIDGIATALSMDAALELFEKFPREKGEASAKRAQRARTILGLQRHPGRPKTGQK